MRHLLGRKIRSNNLQIVRVPPAGTSAADRQLMRETGRRLAQSYLRDPPLMMRR